METEANENVGTADPIVPNATFTGVRDFLGGKADDVDVYAFTTGTTSGKTVAITIASTAKDATFYKAKITNVDGQLSVTQIITLWKQLSVQPMVR